MFNTRKTLVGLVALAFVIVFSAATAEAQVGTSYIYYGQSYPSYGTQIYCGEVYTMPYWRSGVGMYVQTGYPYVRSYTPRTTDEVRPRTSFQRTLPDIKRTSYSDIHDIRPRTAPPRRPLIH
jgi:hypothetical protein